MDNELNLRLIHSAEQMITTLDRMHEITHKLESENASRVVWLVGISGFAILNIPSVFSQKISPTFLDFLPWVITVLFGVFAHWLHRNVSIYNFSLYSTKREQLLVFVINGAKNAIFDDLHKILTNKTEKLEVIGKLVNRATTFATRLEQLTFMSFIISLMLFIYKFIQYSI